MPTKTAVVGIEEVVSRLKIIKRDLKEDITDFLQTSNKWFDKKKKQINKSKQKASLKEICSRKAMICAFYSSDKK